MKASLKKKMAEPEEGDEDYATRKDSYKPCPELEQIRKLLVGNTGIIFTKGDLSEIKKIIDDEKRESRRKTTGKSYGI